MPKNLVIVESPAKAKTIHKLLGKDYEVEASMGHVRDLPKSKMGVDLVHSFSPSYVVIPRSKKIINQLKKKAMNKDSIILAPDPDREGEAISWHLAELLQETGRPIKRITFNEITREAIQEAIRHPRDIDRKLVNAQQARRILDRIVGYNLSPLLWRKVGAGLSAGRVQSVALRLVVEREKEIRAFKPMEYWTIEADLSSRRPGEKEKVFTARLDKIKGEKAEIRNREEGEAHRDKLLKEWYAVLDFDEKERRRRPGPPFTTSKLQQEGFKRLGFSASKSMRIAQRLYEGVELGEEEGVGLITYMRTDSVNVAEGAIREVRKYIGERFGKESVPGEPNRYRAKKGAQEAHEAIRPTSVFREPEKIRKHLSEEEYRLYDLIWKRFVASQMSEAIDLVTIALIQAGSDYLFKASGVKNKFAGYLAVYEEEEEENGSNRSNNRNPLERESQNGEERKKAKGTAELPHLEKEEPLDLHELRPLQHFTKPPARFNDASLVKTLEEKGIGRPSTYAPTIYILITREYAERKGGAFIPTELGELVIDLLVAHFPSILDYEFTAEMEGELDRIEEGELDWVKVLENFYRPFTGWLEKAKETMRNVRKEVVQTEYLCDQCAKPLVIRLGRFGKFLACSDFPKCRFTRSLPTGVKCPTNGCPGELVKRKSKKGRYFYGCSSYPQCTFITNRLPKAEGEAEEEKPPEADGMAV